jgi:hypothetical protein
MSLTDLSDLELHNLHIKLQNDLSDLKSQLKSINAERSRRAQIIVPKNQTVIGAGSITSNERFGKL